MSDIQSRLQYYRREYTVNRLKKRAISLLQQDYKAYRQLAEIGGTEEDNSILEWLYYRIKDQLRKIEQGFKSDCPIAYMQPSYAQAQYLNAWHPDYEPQVAPGGYQSILDVSTVRGGKTYGLIMNMVLWMIPNDPDWPIFEEYEHPKFGKYRVLPRFNWDEWQRSGRRVLSKDEPPKAACEMWFGCVDENHFLTKVEPKWRKLIPAKYVKIREDGQLCWYKSEKTLETKFGTKLTAKLYNSDMTAWSGTELFFIGFDEGPTEDKIDEAVMRSQYMHIAFTPREAANIGTKSSLAKKIYKGDKKLVGKLKTFQFSMEDTEDFILGEGNEQLGEKKKAERLAIAATMGDAGRVAVQGGFFDSSPLVFSNFNPALNILPVTGEMVVRAIRGELTPEDIQYFPWLVKFHNANIIRGFDEGLAHPTACAWFAFLRTGEKVLYRDYEASDTSITDRVERIIDLSGNKREVVNLSDLLTKNHDGARHHALGVQRDHVREQMTGQRTTRYREVWVREPVRRTIADSKIFKRDPEHPLDNWTENYRRAGLVLDRAKNDGPAARCDLVNGLFRPDHTRDHLNPEQGGKFGYGCGLYITRDCGTFRKRVEEYLWEQFKSGPRIGQFTGKPGALDDDLIDSVSYPCIARITWIDPSQYRTSVAHI